MGVTPKYLKGLPFAMASICSDRYRGTDWSRRAEVATGAGGLFPAVVQMKRSPDAFPFFVYGVDLPLAFRNRLSESDRRFPAGGASTREEQAKAAAMAEALERMMFLAWQPRVAMPASAPPDELQSALRDLPFLIPPDESPTDFLRAVAHASGTLWCLPDEVSFGEPCAVPVGLLSAASPAMWEQTTNGMACGATSEEAKRHAILELIERDTLMIAWRRNLHGCELLPQRLLPPDMWDRLTRLDRRNAMVVLRGYQSDVGIPVVVAAIVRGHRTAPTGAAIGAAASATFRAAAVRAVTEAVLAWAGLCGRPDRLTASPARPDDPTDFAGHLHYYQRADSAAHLAQWLTPTDARPERIDDDADGALAWILAKLHSAGLRVLFFDMTSSEVASLGLHVVRAIVPGLVPLSVGNWHARHLDRFSSPPRFHIGARLPGDPDTNAEPHPFP